MSSNSWWSYSPTGAQFKHPSQPGGMCWYLDQIPEPLCPVLPGGWLLRLTRARAQDGGHYSCLASNIAGEARRHFYVEVLGKESSSEGFLLGFQSSTLAGTDMS